jgi:hypothetical protein
MQYFGPEDREEGASPTSHHHVADQWHAQLHRSHALGHAYHDAHHSGDIECPLGEAELDGETDSTTDDTELKIGRKRQIIGILV